MHIKSSSEGWAIFADSGVNIAGKITFSGMRCSNLLQRVIARVGSFLGFGYVVKVEGDLTIPAKYKKSNQPFPPDVHDTVLTGAHYFWVNRTSWNEYAETIYKHAAKVNDVALNIFAKQLTPPDNK